MLTGRGWWFLILTTGITFLGVVWLGWVSATVAILGLSLLSWFLIEWLVFAARVRRATGCVRIHRELVQGDRVVPAIWTGSRVTVRITVTLEAHTRLPFVIADDRLPAEFSQVKRSKATLALEPWKPQTFEYELVADTPGVLRFEGVHLRFADLAGFCYQRRFLREPVEYLVLPPLTNDEGRHRGTKRFNTLPPPGMHRLRRPGSGDELLDLREYRPGDPPKMIAWKASARREILITKEFENDVPVRCMLFLDTSNAARIGPSSQTPLTRSSSIASGIAQAATASRDLVGLTLFDEEGSSVTQPARTRAHAVHLMRTLAEAAAILPDPKITDAEMLSRYAHPIAMELYPDLMRRDLNSRPWGMYWMPLADSRLFWFVPIVFFGNLLLATQAEWINSAAKLANELKPRTGYVWFDLLVLLDFLWLFTFFPMICLLIFWFFHGIRGFFAPRATRTLRRKQLGALYADQDGTGPAAIERALHDDLYFAERSTRFLVEHRVNLPLAMHDATGVYRFRCPERAGTLAKAMVQAVTRARDNELYVLLADLNELSEDELQPVLNATRMARARHHQVLVMVPWPKDMPDPDEKPEEKPRVRINAVIRSALIARYHRKYTAMKYLFTKAGATVVRVEDGDPIALVLERLDRLRGVRTRR